MEMVAAARLRRAQTRVESARPYGLKMQQMLESLAGAAAGLNHPLFEERQVKSTLLVVVAADRGLCGSYNSNILRTANRYIAETPKDSVKLGLIGKKAVSFFKKRPHPIAFKLEQSGGKADLAFPPADPMAFHPNCHFLLPDLWSRYEEARQCGVFYFWGHSYEIISDAMWADFEKMIERISADPHARWGTVADLFAPTPFLAPPSHR